jgi:hypothetical protein
VIGAKKAPRENACAGADRGSEERWRVERWIAQKKTGERDVKGCGSDCRAGPVENGDFARVIDEEIERVEVAVADDCSPL